jgi:thiamine-phosphate pyrophosphorylase
MKRFGKLCVITDTVIQKKYSHIEIAKMAIRGGAGMIQFRDKHMRTSEMAETATSLSKLCKKHSVTFIVNDRVDVAMLSNADGVHLGMEDISVKDARKLLGRTKIIGATAHSLSEAKRAVHEGADYIGFGHIYHTGSKIRTTKPVGVKKLAEICRKVKLSVIAIGGISSANAADVMEAGAYGFAVIGSVLRSNNPAREVKKLREIIDE